MKTKISVVSQLCTILLVIGAISLTAAVRAADTNATGGGSALSGKDKTLIEKAAEGGAREVGVGQGAGQKGESEGGKKIRKPKGTAHGKDNDKRQTTPP